MFIPHYVSCVLFHTSHVTCYVSRVTCHMSPVTCHNVFFLKFFIKKNNIYIYIIFFSLNKLKKVVGLVGGGSVINGAYPVQFFQFSASHISNIFMGKYYTRYTIKVSQDKCLIAIVQTDLETCFKRQRRKNWYILKDVD